MKLNKDTPRRAFAALFARLPMARFSDHVQAVMLRRLVESSDDDGGEALFDAIAGRNVPLALGLIHAGAAVRYSKSSSFPLTFAGSAGPRLVEVPVPNKSVAIRAVEMGLATVVKALADYGADVTEPLEPQGLMPLPPVQLASMCGYVDVIDVLVQAGAPVEPSEAHCFSPLAAATLGGHKTAASRLLELGADVNLALFGQLTALNVAAVSLTSSADDGDGGMVSLLLKAGAAANGAPGIKSTLDCYPARLAVQQGNTEALSLLLRANASVILHSTNNMKTTLLHGAVAANRIDMVDEIVSIYPKPKAWHMFLLGAGAAGLRHKKLRRSPRFAPPPGFLGKLYKKDVLRHIHSFLHKRRYLDDLDTLDSDGYTAAQYAKGNDYDDILKLLVENGAIMPCPGCALPSKAPPSLPSSSMTILLHDDDDDLIL